MSLGRQIQGRHIGGGIRQHVGAFVLIVCAFLIASTTAAFAYWSATGSGSASAKTTTLGAGSQPSATVSGRDVSLSWSAFTNATSYTVARSNVSPQSLSTTLHGTCAGSPTGTSCTDTGVVENGTASTNWTYSDAPNVQNWVGGTSVVSATVTIPGPTLSVGSASVTTAGGTASNVAVANFFDNETVTYCVDNDTTSCPAADTTTPATATVPATGGTVTTSTLAIPSGLSAGSHTLFAKGSLGSDPTGITFTVTSVSGPLASFTVSNPGTQTAGVPFNVTVTALDSGGHPAIGWTSTTGCVVFSGPSNSPSPSNAAPIYPAPTGSCSSGQSALSFNASGQATASITLFNASSTTNLSVKDAATLTKTGSSGTFAVNSGGANLSFNSPPVFGKNTTWTSAVNIGKDAYGNSPLYAGTGITITLTLADGTHFSVTAGSTGISTTQISASVTATSTPSQNFTVEHTDAAGGKSTTLTASSSAAGFTAANNGVVMVTS